MATRKRETAFRKSFRYFIGRLANAVVVYDHSTAAKLVSAGWDPERVYVALNSLDQRPIAEARERWRRSPSKLDAFRREHGLGSGPLVLFVSRLHEDNRLEILLEAARIMRSKHPNLRIVLIGDGPDLPRLKRLARELDLSDSVLFPGAIYDEDALAPWFLSSDVFCYPRNIGLSILHAFGYELPVVTSDRIDMQNPGDRSTSGERNGLLYQDGDTDSLSRTLLRILDDPRLRDRLAEGARRTVQERFTISGMVDGIVHAVEYAFYASRSDRRRSLFRAE